MVYPKFKTALNALGLLVVWGCNEPVLYSPTDRIMEPNCLAPQTSCEGQCVDTMSDAQHCGGCNMGCDSGSYCHQGACASGCPSGFRACDLVCVDVMIDRDNCGGCDQKCPSGASCEQGVCGAVECLIEPCQTTTCETGLTACDNLCVDLNSDAAHCGFCSRSCETGFRCVGGSCECAGGSVEQGADCENNIDDDCDGLVDCADPDCVGHERSCAPACGRQTCEAGGAYGACLGEAEICGDGIDQDCDGYDDRAPDVWEPNDNCQTCIPVAENSTDPWVYIDARFDTLFDPIDCYSFVGVDNEAEMERIKLNLTNIPVGHNYDLVLYRNQADCEAVRPLAVSTNAGNLNESIEWTETPNRNHSGTYIVQVLRFTGASCSENYRLTIEGLR